MSQTNVVARINEVSIVILDNKEKLVPIRPICDALGVDYSGQLQKIKEDDILASVVGLSPTTGSDKKVYEMTCLPLEFVFGWLFSINHKNVKPEAKETVKRYKMECYHALYKHFTEYAEYVEERQKRIDEWLEKIKETKTQFKETKNKLLEEQAGFEDIRANFTFNKWKSEKSQLEFSFN